MDSLLAVEKEVDKALDSFDAFYQGVDDDIDKVLDTVLKNMNEIMRSIHFYSLICILIDSSLYFNY